MPLDFDDIVDGIGAVLIGGGALVGLLAGVYLMAIAPDGMAFYQRVLFGALGAVLGPIGGSMIGGSVYGFIRSLPILLLAAVASLPFLIMLKLFG